MLASILPDDYSELKVDRNRLFIKEKKLGTGIMSLLNSIRITMKPIIFDCERNNSESCVLGDISQVFFKGK